MNNLNKTILTLDAGGTNLVFSAIQNNKIITEADVLPSNPNNLEKCIATIINGFKLQISKIKEAPTAISFAFPGPANYEKGIIGDLPNFPAFTGGVPLGAILENHFNLPVFINNDGNLFAYGEALAGVLPEINQQLIQNNSTKQYKSLIGITLGTGIGGGLIFNKQLITGDNSSAAEIWLTGNRHTPTENAEKGASTQFIINNYSLLSKTKNDKLMPFDVYRIAKGEQKGDQVAAKNTYESFGRNLGEIIANLITTFDGLVVIGGGITGARDLYLPSLMNELKGSFGYNNIKTQKRLIQEVYNYDDIIERKSFLNQTSQSLRIPNSDKLIDYDPIPKTAVIHSSIGASSAICLGAYQFAINKIKEMAVTSHI